MTNTTISCLPVPGTTSLTEDSNIDSDGDDIIVNNTDISEDFDQEDAEKEGGIFGGIRFPTRTMLKHEEGFDIL